MHAPTIAWAPLVAARAAFRSISNDVDVSFFHAHRRVVCTATSIPLILSYHPTCYVPDCCCRRDVRLRVMSQGGYELLSVADAIDLLNVLGARDVSPDTAPRLVQAIHILLAVGACQDVGRARE